MFFIFEKLQAMDFPIYQDSPELRIIVGDIRGMLAAKQEQLQCCLVEIKKHDANYETMGAFFPESFKSGLESIPLDRLKGSIAVVISYYLDACVKIIQFSKDVIDDTDQKNLFAAAIYIFWLKEAYDNGFIMRNKNGNELNPHWSYLFCGDLFNYCCDNLRPYLSKQYLSYFRSIKFYPYEQFSNIRVLEDIMSGIGPMDKVKFMTNHPLNEYEPDEQVLQLNIDVQKIKAKIINRHEEAQKKARKKIKLPTMETYYVDKQIPLKLLQDFLLLLTAQVEEYKLVFASFQDSIRAHIQSALTVSPSPASPSKAMEKKGAAPTALFVLRPPTPEPIPEEVVPTRTEHIAPVKPVELTPAQLEHLRCQDAKKKPALQKEVIEGTDLTLINIFVESLPGFEYLGVLRELERLFPGCIKKTASGHMIKIPSIKDARLDSSYIFKDALGDAIEGMISTHVPHQSEDQRPMAAYKRQILKALETQGWIMRQS